MNCAILKNVDGKAIIDSMSDTTKISNKDYSSCIDFPVEIMGKDGRVRFYTFEESIHLYQRRIRAARLRYTDSKKIEKEVQHCSKRIGQLRRSYFARYGWETFQMVGNVPSDLPLELTAEISAYLRRFFSCGTHHSPAMLEKLDRTDEYWLFSVTVEGWSGLLYLLDNPDNINSVLNRLQSIHHAEQEHIVDVSKLLDMVMVVTAFDDVEVPKFKESEAVRASQTRFGIEALHQGKVVEALAHFILVTEQTPYYRQAYWAGSILAEQLRVHEQAQMLLNMGVSYFPTDIALWCRKAAIELRLNLWNEFEASMTQIKHLDKGFQEHLLDIIYLYLRGQHRTALKKLRIKLNRKDNPLLRPSVLWLQKELLRGILIERLIGISSLIWLYLIVIGNVAFTAGLVISVALWILVRMQQHIRLKRALRGQGFFQLNLLGGTDIHNKRNPLQDEH